MIRLDADMLFYGVVRTDNPSRFTVNASRIPAEKVLYSRL